MMEQVSPPPAEWSCQDLLQMQLDSGIEPSKVQQLAIGYFELIPWLIHDGPLKTSQGLVRKAQSEYHWEPVKK